MICFAVLTHSTIVTNRWTDKTTIAYTAFMKQKNCNTIERH